MTEQLNWTDRKIPLENSIGKISFFFIFSIEHLKKYVYFFLITKASHTHWKISNISEIFNLGKKFCTIPPPTEVTAVIRKIPFSQLEILFSPWIPDAPQLDLKRQRNDQIPWRANDERVFKAENVYRNNWAKGDKLKDLIPSHIFCLRIHLPELCLGLD